MGVASRSYYAANADAISAYQRERYAADREKILERKRELYAANRLRILEQKKIWREANPEKVRGYTARWRERTTVNDRREYDHARYTEQREVVLERSKAWRRANPDKGREMQAKRRAAKAKVPIEAVAVSEIFRRDNWHCGICGEPVDPTLKWPDPWSSSLDHIVPISKGGPHIPSNVQCAHVQCNVRKFTRLKIMSPNESST